jgi:hypothetical protein
MDTEATRFKQTRLCSALLASKDQASGLLYQMIYCHYTDSFVLLFVFILSSDDGSGRTRDLHNQ